MQIIAPSNWSRIVNQTGVDPIKLEKYIESTQQRDDYFAVHGIKKRKGGYRDIYIYNRQSEWLKNFHKATFGQLFKPLRSEVHSAAHGFLNARSIVTNAKIHLGARYLLHLDIETFFDSITALDIKNFLLHQSFPEELADKLACAHSVDGFLRQGLVNSPDISNHVFYSHDIKLAELALQHGARYTRYGDDLAFSLEVDPENLLDGIERYFSVQSLKVNKSKTKIQKRGANQYVTGLTIFDGKYPRLPKKYKRWIRLQFYLIEKNGIIRYAYPGFDPHDIESLAMAKMEAHRVLTSLEGTVSYMHSVEVELAKKYWQKINNFREELESV